MTMIGYLFHYLDIDIEKLLDEILNNSFNLSDDYFNKLKKIKSKRRKRKGLKYDSKK